MLGWAEACILVFSINAGLPVSPLSMPLMLEHSMAFSRTVLPFLSFVQPWDIAVWYPPNLAKRKDFNR